MPCAFGSKTPREKPQPGDAGHDEDLYGIRSMPSTRSTSGISSIRSFPTVCARATTEVSPISERAQRLVDPLVSVVVRQERGVPFAESRILKLPHQ